MKPKPFSTLTIHTTETDRRIVLLLEGDIALTSIDYFEDIMSQQFANASKPLMLDFHGVSYISMHGLVLLNRLARRFHEIGRPFQCIRLQPTVREAFDLVQLDHLQSALETHRPSFKQTLKNFFKGVWLRRIESKTMNQSKFKLTNI